MTRLLGLAVLGFLIWLGLETLLARARGALSGRPRPDAMPGKERAAATQVLVRCAGCGVYVPQSRMKAGSGGEAVYCERCTPGS